MGKMNFKLATGRQQLAPVKALLVEYCHFRKGKRIEDHIKGIRATRQ